MCSMERISFYNMLLLDHQTMKMNKLICKHFRNYIQDSHDFSRIFLLYVFTLEIFNSFKFSKYYFYK